MGRRKPGNKGAPTPRSVPADRNAAAGVLLTPGRPYSDAFEQEVRRLARAVFPSNDGYSAVILEGRERDGVLNDGETIHIIECTRNPSKEKARDDLQKSCDLKRSLRNQYSEHNFKIWFITERDPTADQMLEAEAAKKKAKCPVVAMSFSTFGQKIIDAPSYIQARESYNFGSIRYPDPDKPNQPVNDEDFIPLDMVDVTFRATISPEELAEKLRSAPGNFLLLGDFGAGKSMTLRHVFFRLRDDYRKGNTSKFPVYLNLRDHVGQDDPASALYDHGRKIGFSQPERLVRAWRSGFVHLLLDGFDEIVSSRFRIDSGGLRQVRIRAMTLLKSLVSEHPLFRTSLLVSGRANYFSNDDERNRALGFTRNNVAAFTLNDFTTDQVSRYLKRLGLDNDVIPEWLPSRPLLVGYLAVRRLLQKTGTSLGDMTRAEGWEYLLSQISHREGNQIADLGGQTEGVRAFVDRLATRARTTSSGRGPVAVRDMIDVFRQLMPTSPDEAAQQLLLRMAGLTISTTERSAVVAASPDQEDAREFVDDDLVDAARSGDVVRFIRYNFDDHLNAAFQDPDCIITMGPLGVEVASFSLKSVSEGQFTSSLRYAAETVNSPALAMDIARIMQFLGRSIVKDDQKESSIVIRNGYFSDIEISGGCDLSSLMFVECMFGSVHIERGDDAIQGPVLKRCQIEHVFGAASREDLPNGVVEANTEIANFDKAYDGERGVADSFLSPGVRVLLISLRKLFTQAGRGRKENAFPRGLDETERAFVGEVLEIISRHGLASPQRISGPPIWIPSRSRKGEVLGMFRAPQESQHPALVEARLL